MSELGIEIPKGSPAGMRAGAASASSASGALERVYGGLQTSGSIAGWRGMAALAYRDTATTQAQSAGYAYDAISQAGHALMRAADVLEQSRRQAKHALELAREADRRAQAARARIEAAAQAAAAAQAQIRSLDFQAAMAPDALPQTAARAAAASSLQAAEQDMASSHTDLSQAEAELERAQEKGCTANLRWEAEGERTGQELAGLAGHAGAVAPALGFGQPRPALGGGGGQLSFNTFLPLPGTPRRLTPAQMAAENARRGEADEEDWRDQITPRLPSLHFPTPDLNKTWKTVKKLARKGTFVGCYVEEAWTDKTNGTSLKDLENEAKDLARCAPIVGGAVIKDDGEK